MNTYTRDEILTAALEIDNTRVFFLDDNSNVIYTDSKQPIDETLIIAKMLQIRAEKPLNDLRKIRNGLLRETDVYMLADYPISETQKTVIIQYRAALRDLPTYLQGQNLDVTNLYQYLPTKPEF